MDAMLLQAVVEKLEDIELLVRYNNQNKDGEELKKISAEIKDLSSQTMSAEKINELIKSLNPRSKRIEHRHHLHKGIWIAIALFIINIVLVRELINSDNTTKQLRVNDLKYRALKTMEDAGMKKVLSNIDRLYKINPEYFEKKVNEEEDSFSNRLKQFKSKSKKEKN